MRRALLALVVVASACDAVPTAVDAAMDDGAVADAAAGDAFVADAFAVDASAPSDASDGLPRFDDLCRTADGDAVLGLVANETLTCRAGADATALLFPGLPTLGADFTALHALCARMTPAAGTRDDLTDAALAADLRAWMTTLLSRPALVRAFAGGPSDPAAQLAALEAAWLPENAFEHVFCGELDPAGTGVYGLHMWSEWALAEGEGRANYQCTTAAIDRHEVVTARYQWQPEMRTTFANKPVGSFQVGMSPACMLALGYRAIRDGVPDSMSAAPAFHAHMYDEEVSFAFGSFSGAVVTMYATEQ